jgi:alkanesulfonate monooxygenase SsuD/methylene tetrahydromethanopterin reductase-like flavin-dependent oxidoreductase (luciferase family)
MLWRGEPVTHHEGDVELTDHTIGPLPWDPAGPPVLITAANRGEMLDAQFTRFGRLGDGIITTYVHAEECRLVRERAEEALARHGRAGTRFELCVYTTVRMEDDPRTAERVTTEFLATYYGGGVHSRGTMGLGPADVVIACAHALRGGRRQRSVRALRGRRPAGAAGALHHRSLARPARLTRGERRQRRTTTSGVPIAGQELDRGALPPLGHTQIDARLRHA